MQHCKLFRVIASIREWAKSRMSSFSSEQKRKKHSKGKIDSKKGSFGFPESKSKIKQWSREQSG
jgi:hypothetical protein